MPVAAIVMLSLAASGPAAAASGGAVAFVPAATVAAAFAKGMPLVEQSDLEVHASRRDGPGQAEVHARNTDVIYVLSGRAVLATGGRVEGATALAPDEIRGAAIAGGVRRLLAAGDVLIVPRGVPHQFVQVDAPFTYYVVKVAGPAEDAR